MKVLVTSLLRPLLLAKVASRRHEPRPRRLGVGSPFLGAALQRFDYGLSLSHSAWAAHCGCRTKASVGILGQGTGRLE
jgi:hypothetical protein